MLEAQLPSPHPRPAASEALLDHASQPQLRIRITWEGLKNIAYP